MRHSSLSRGTAAFAALSVSLVCAVTGTAVAGAGQRAEIQDNGASATDGYGAAAAVVAGRSSFSWQQHDGSADHLPARRENIELVSKLEPLSQGPIVPGQIADVAVFKNTAYLASWNRGTDCDKGGFYAVDISNPAAPRELAFRAAAPGTYHGEGMHAITLNTASFKGDVLATNNEPCTASGQGGFDLYDVTNPADPKPLVIGAGDRTVGDAATDTKALANSSHSTFLWQAGDKAYAVAVDNTEAADVDIYDITDPRAPKRVGEFDLLERFPQIEGNSANGASIFLHDMTVKQIEGRWIMLASYWDAGYVQLDVTDPANPTLVGDTDFGTTDPLTGKVPPEGNGHYAEFTHDNRYFLGADEDFSPFRFKEFRMTTGANQGAYEAGEFGWTKPIATLPDNTVNGPTIYGGYGCDASPAIPSRASAGFTLQPGEEAIVVLSRGPVQDPNNPYPACTFQEKATNAAAAGYDAVIIANHHVGSGAGQNPDAVLCGSGTSADVYGICIGHRLFHLMFNETPDYPVPYNTNDPDEPTIGTHGEKVSGSVEFDGWGYGHLFDRNTGAELDAYAIEESLDERFAFGFGDLTIHEWATDPTENLAYAAYYAGGIRVAKYGSDGLSEVGSFIDVGGSNFWGVEQFTGTDGERYIAGSDRDYGLYILRYTGPGAAKPPACEDVTVTTAYGRAVDVPLRCTDPNGNPTTLSIVTAPTRGTLGVINQTTHTVSYTPKASPAGAGFEDTFTFRTSDGAALSPAATARIRVTPDPEARCVTRLVGTAGRDLLNGTPFGDLIQGLGGNDTLDGLEGKDCLEGGPGDDRLLGGTNDDRLNGGSGADSLNGGPGQDVLTGADGKDALGGGSNADRLSGGNGNDSLRGEAGNDTISGGAGNDRLDAGKGANTLSGGAGNDRLFAANGRRDRVRCGSGFDSVNADRTDRVASDCERVSRTRRTRG